MTIQQIAEVANVGKATVQDWIHKMNEIRLISNEIRSSISEKVGLAQKAKKPADFTLPETIAIIRAGGNETLASLLEQNAVQPKTPEAAPPVTQITFSEICQLAGISEDVLRVRLSDWMKKNAKRAGAYSVPLSELFTKAEASKVMEPHPSGTTLDFARLVATEVAKILAPTLQQALPAGMKSAAIPATVNLVYHTVRDWCRIHHRFLSNGEAVRVGRMCAELSRIRGIKIGYDYAASTGAVNSYSLEILAEVTGW